MTPQAQTLRVRYTLEQRRASHRAYLLRELKRGQTVPRLGNSDPLQLGQTVTPDSGNAARPCNDTPARPAPHISGTGRHLGEGRRDAQEDEPHTD